MKNTLLLLLVVFVNSSCRKVTEYEIVIQNQTGYRLDRIYFSSREEEIEPSVDANGETKVFLGIKKRFGFIAAPSLDFRIANYSDSVGDYTSTIGTSIAVDNLYKDRLNTIKVIDNPNALDELIFKYTINE